MLYSPFNIRQREELRKKEGIEFSNPPMTDKEKIISTIGMIIVLVISAIIALTVF